MHNKRMASRETCTLAVLVAACKACIDKVVIEALLKKGGGGGGGGLMPADPGVL